LFGSSIKVKALKVNMNWVVAVIYISGPSAEQCHWIEVIGPGTQVWIGFGIEVLGWGKVVVS